MKHVSKTSIFVGVNEGFEYSVMMKHASLITGIPGIGKTTALEEIARLNPQATMIRAAATQNTPRAALNLIADALRIHAYGKAASVIWDTLESYFSDPRMNYILVLDEAQNLPLAILKEMVDLPQRYEIPVVICGNGELLRRRRASAAFDQIESRIAKRAILSAPTREDFEMIAVDFDAFGKDAHAACVAYGCNTSMRDLVAMLEAARGYAGQGPLRLQEIKHAVCLKNGAHALKLLSRAA
ncbi:MAG: ATP-binding protein [Methylocystis sp.]